MTRTTHPPRSSRSKISPGSSTGQKTKFAREGNGSKPIERNSPASRSRSSTTELTSGGIAQRRDSKRRRERRDRSGRLAAAQFRRDLRRRERVADACAREPERFREGADHDDVLVGDQPRSRLVRVLEVRLVHGERPRVGERPELAESDSPAGTRR